MLGSSHEFDSCGSARELRRVDHACLPYTLSPAPSSAITGGGSQGSLRRYHSFADGGFAEQAMRVSHASFRPIAFDGFRRQRGLRTWRGRAIAGRSADLRSAWWPAGTTSASRLQWDALRRVSSQPPRAPPGRPQAPASTAAGARAAPLHCATPPLAACLITAAGCSACCAGRARWQRLAHPHRRQRSARQRHRPERPRARAAPPESRRWPRQAPPGACGRARSAGLSRAQPADAAV